MIVNYKYPAICAIGVGTTDDALGNYSLAAVSEEGENFFDMWEAFLIPLLHNSQDNLRDFF